MLRLFIHILQISKSDHRPFISLSREGSSSRALMGQVEFYLKANLAAEGSASSRNNLGQADTPCPGHHALGSIYHYLQCCAKTTELQSKDQLVVYSVSRVRLFATPWTVVCHGQSSVL